jgi:hypothetical protein
VALARNSKMGTSKVNHLLMKSGSDQEQEDGTKGREVGSSNDGSHHPSPSCRRNSEGYLSAGVGGENSGHPAATRRLVARFHCRKLAAEDDEERRRQHVAGNQLAKECREVHRPEYARWRRLEAQGRMPELGRIARKLE